MAQQQAQTQEYEILIRERLVNRDPAPKVFTQADVANGFQPNVPATLSYQNKGNESSEILKLTINAAPRVLVTIRKTISNQAQEIFPQVMVGDIDGVIDFKKASCKPLTVGRGEYIYIDLVHTYPSNQSFSIVMEKDQLLWVDEQVRRKKQ